MRTSVNWRIVIRPCGLLGVLCVLGGNAGAQSPHTHDDPMQAAASTAMSEAMDSAASVHMEMTALRPHNRRDAERAAEIVAEVRRSIAKYRDVKVAEHDGFRKFAPQMKNQRVYHFTNNFGAIENQFRFNAKKPTSLLYRKNGAGDLILTGAMYTAPAFFSERKLDDRVPLSVAQWHKHINWCVPRRGESERWGELRDGRPVFGPMGVSSEADCKAVTGRFMSHVFGWMVHANVFESEDPQVIWGGEHMRKSERPLSK